MADEFEGTVDLEINGQLEEDVEEVEIQELEGRGTVELMNKTGFFNRHPVLIYFVLAFPVSWGLTLLVTGTGRFSGQPTPGLRGLTLPSGR